MLLILVFTLAFIAGIIIYNKVDDDAGLAISIIASIILAIALVAIPCSSCYSTFYNNYTYAELYLAQTQGTPTAIVEDKVITINTEIVANQNGIHNPWVNVYYSSKIAETPLLPIS